jgi:hypothetical protein
LAAASRPWKTPVGALVCDRYNIVEDDLRDAVKRIEAGRAISASGSGQSG